MTKTIILMTEEMIRHGGHDSQIEGPTPMPQHRFSHLLTREPQPALPASLSGGLVACPVALRQGLSAATLAWQQQIYQRAWEEAHAVVRPSVLERLQAGLLN
jgi:hypothetical protein